MKGNQKMSFITENGSSVGALGQGTWYLGENTRTFQREKNALCAGIEAGMNLIDTAEMYGEGAAEKLVGAAIQGYDRDDLFLVSKVYPHNAGRKNIFRCCENTLRRMNCDYLDLYLLHWRGHIPLRETVECMEELVQQGRIRAWGVSNLDTDDMEELFRAGGSNCATDQVLYHLGSRGIEYDLLPLLRQHEIPVMAYSPLAQAGRLRRGMMTHRVVTDIAHAHNATPSQVLLGFLLAQKDIFPIPRSSRAEHTLENAAAMELVLTTEEVKALDRAFPAPNRKTYLDMI